MARAVRRQRRGGSAGDRIVDTLCALRTPRIVGFRCPVGARADQVRGESPRFQVSAMLRSCSLLVVLSLLPACGGDDPAAAELPPVGSPGAAAAADGDTWLHDYESILRDMAAVLQGVDDAASAEAAVSEMEALGARLATLRADAEARGGLDVAGQAMGDPQAWAAGAARLGQVQPLLNREVMRLGMDPELREHLQELTDAMGAAMEPVGR